MLRNATIPDFLSMSEGKNTSICVEAHGLFIYVDKPKFIACLIALYDASLKLHVEYETYSNNDGAEKRYNVTKLY